MLMGRQFEPRVLAVEMFPVQHCQHPRRSFSFRSVDAQNFGMGIGAQQGRPVSGQRKVRQIFDILGLTRDFLPKVDSRLNSISGFRFAILDSSPQSGLFTVPLGVPARDHWKLCSRFQVQSSRCGAGTLNIERWIFTQALSHSFPSKPFPVSAAPPASLQQWRCAQRWRPPAPRPECPLLPCPWRRRVRDHRRLP